jgi:hypothetical protein
VFDVVATTNVVPNVANVVDLQWSPFNLHVHLHQSANALRPLETLCHVPSQLLGSTPSIVSLVKC